MGVWGYGIFENDEALDWLHVLMKGDDVIIIKTTLNSALINDLYIGMPIACEVLAAAEIIRSVANENASDLPDDYRTWIMSRDHKSYRGFVVMAMEAVKRVRENSELRDLWSKTTQFEEWKVNLDVLEAELARICLS